MPAIFVGSLLLLVIGGFGFTRAERADDAQAPRPHTEEKAGRLILHAVAAKTGLPMEGVSVHYNGSSGEKPLGGTVTTGKDGAATIDYRAGSSVSMLEITATTPGHVPIFIRWDRFGKPATIPASKELRFEPGRRSEVS